MIQQLSQHMNGNGLYITSDPNATKTIVPNTSKVILVEEKQKKDTLSKSKKRNSEKHDVNTAKALNVIPVKNNSFDFVVCYMVAGSCFGEITT